ncbi:hypothetical protein EW146_g1375 [Bondarzewia mesenterica]|uniref:Peptidase C14 caspase domain-containing protein n=1 Tax=Bondarzewia mesenterica TaxID=1095465 RepID=A0A4S4M406_9AGAM|nr:hypothetical protein EW146_g1375 [Bondarzewia mesenterica]
MATRVFALIIGVDQYKSSRIWNLSSCVDDAQSIKRWLMTDLHVPRDHIRILLDGKATKRAIEDTFVSHLVSNPAIEPGDAILIYFAGHGSRMLAPDGWHNTSCARVEMLCPHDHDTRGRDGRVSGITDWSMHAMIEELCEVKGDNITLVLDCCFSPAQSRMNTRSRRSTRWTPTDKVTSDDLYVGLWRGALRRNIPFNGEGFCQRTSSTHVTLLACGHGERAMEDKEGGRFTAALLEAKDKISFHRMSYSQLVSKLSIKEDSQHAVCAGKNHKRALFGGAPFVPDTRYVPALCSEKDIRIDAGAIHGIVQGTEFSMHEHNCKGSFNPVLAVLSVFEVHSTWCRARAKSPIGCVMNEGWARITKWNNRTPFRVHLKKTCSSFLQWWRLRQHLPTKMEEALSAGGLNIIRVRRASDADVSVQRLHKHLAIEHHDVLLAKNGPRIVYVPSEDATTDADTIDAAARFHLHLYRKNAYAPLCDKVSLQLFRMDDRAWSKVGTNLLIDGRAHLSLEKGTIYSVVLENKSDVDLWPYLFWMDASGYIISSIYQPDPAASSPPLARNSQLHIGTGNAGSEALSFCLIENEAFNSGFLKLFVSTVRVPMNMLEQGFPVTSLDVGMDAMPAGANEAAASNELWDSQVACVTIVRGMTQMID